MTGGYKFRVRSAIAILMIITVTFAVTLDYFGLYNSYADAQSDLDKTNEELERLRSEQDTLNSEFSELNEKVAIAGEKVAEVELLVNEKQQEINDCNNRLSLIETEVNEQYRAMSLRIKYMYESFDAGTLHLLLSSDSLSDMLLKTKYITDLSEYDHNKLSELKQLLESQVSLKDELSKDLEELVVLKDNANKEADNLAVLVNELSSKIDANSDSIKEAEALALEYEKKVQAEYEERLRREREAAAAAGNSPGGIVDNSDVSDQRGSGIIENTPYNLALLSAIIECEAGNQSYEGKCAVGSVVVNRVYDARFPDTIAGVIYSPNQFSPVASGRFAIVLARGATNECVTAAQAVLNGYKNIDALYFHAYNPALDSGGIVIGDHVFY